MMESRSAADHNHTHGRTVTEKTSLYEAWVVLALQPDPLLLPLLLIFEVAGSLC
jgi:hypothetical protein